MVFALYKTRFRHKATGRLIRRRNLAESLFFQGAAVGALLEATKSRL